MSTDPAPVLKHPCSVCGGDANARNNWRRECAVVDCPHRHRARQYDGRHPGGALVPADDDPLADLFEDHEP